MDGYDSAVYHSGEFAFFDHLYRGGTQYRTAALIRTDGDPSPGRAAIGEVWCNRRDTPIGAGYVSSGVPVALCAQQRFAR
jgi:hypothetical protein